MEKVVYCLRRPVGTDADAFRDRLVDDVAARLVKLGARDVQVLAADSPVEPASTHRVESGLMPLPDALVTGWLDSANAPLRAAYDEAVAEADPNWFGYVVSESLPLPGTVEGPGRATGYAQLAFLRRPAERPLDEWLGHWHGTHSRIAMEMQATTRYVQNLVVRPLTAETPALSAIVEEVFPTAAMTDPAVFFDAQDDPERQQANIARLMDSVAAFLDFAEIDVVPMSRHLTGPPC